MADQMSGKELVKRARKAAKRYLERIGYDIEETRYECPFGTADIVARDGNCLVFVEVVTNTVVDHGFPPSVLEPEHVAEREMVAASYLADLAESDFPVRFDVVSLLVVGADRAFLRHHINALGGAF